MCNKVNFEKVIEVKNEDQIFAEQYNLNMYIDSHTHLDFFEENIDKAINDINENKIIVLANSMDIESYNRNKEFATKSQYIKPSFGIHPWKAAEFKDDLEKLIPYIEESEAIGEIGLDFFWMEDRSTYDKQRSIFEYILKESIKRNKVVTLHTKGAEEEVYKVLNEYNYNKVIIHWYSGSIETLDKLIKLGCYFTISVDIGYSEVTTNVLDRIPIERILVETDGPTALEWVNGEYAYPSEIKDVVLKIAKNKNISVEKLKNIIVDNNNRLFNLL